MHVLMNSSFHWYETRYRRKVIPSYTVTKITMGTGSFPGVKRPGRGDDHLPPSKCRGHERVGLYLYSPSGPQWPVIGRTFTFTFTVTTRRQICLQSYALLN